MPKRGFTLIELLLVILIIGVLASTVLASMSGSKARGKDTAIKADLATIQTQGSLYYNIGSTFGGAVAGNCSASGTMFSNSGTTVEDIIGTAIADAKKNTKDGNLTCKTACVRQDGTADSSKCAAGATNAFVVYGQLNGGATTKYWCVDSRGASLEVGSAPSGYLCPSS